jgi:hypothetical protein
LDIDGEEIRELGPTLTGFMIVWASIFLKFKVWGWVMLFIG